MRGGLPFWCMILMAAVVAAPASASDPRIPSWRQSHLLEGDRAVNTLYRVATCLAVRHSGEAEALLATVPGTAQEAAAFAALMPESRSGCLAPTRRMTLYPQAHLRRIHMMRGAIAESLLRSGVDRPLHPPQPAAGIGPALVAGGDSEPIRRGREVALCAAGLQPAGIYELLQFNPSSPGEYRQLQALRPILEQCLPPGAPLRADRLTIRLLLAEALHRVSHRSAPASAQASER